MSIDKDRLVEVRNWFTCYVKAFHYDDLDIQRNIDLKKRHTLRVCKEIVHIGEQLGLDADELRMAETIALLHDIGRFEQYALYKTFLDKASENHAEIGLRVLDEFDVLASWDSRTSAIIRYAILHHNQPYLPHNGKKSGRFYLKLLRDADKLDIWKIVTNHYRTQPNARNPAISLNLPDTPGISAPVCDELVNRKIVSAKHVRNLNDLKLLQIGWIFDVNFQPTVDLVNSRGYLRAIRKTLPAVEVIDKIFEIIQTTCFTRPNVLP